MNIPYESVLLVWRPAHTQLFIRLHQLFQSGRLLSHLVHFTLSFMFVDIWDVVSELFLQPVCVPAAVAERDVSLIGCV